MDDDLSPDLLKTKRGRPCLLNDGYLHRLHRKNSQQITWVCVKQKQEKCKGRVKTNLNREVLSKTEHSCSAIVNDADLVIRRKMEVCKIRAREDLDTPVSKIFREEFAEFKNLEFDSPYKIPKYDDVKTNLCKERRKAKMELGMIPEQQKENSESVYVVQEIDCEETSNHDGLESASGDLPEGLQSTPSNGTVWPEPAANSNPAKVEDQEIPSIESTYIKKELDCEETSASCVLGFTTRDLPNVSEQIEPSPINCEMDSNPSSSTPTPVQHQKANQKNERMEASETGPVRVASSTTPQLGSFKRKRSLEDRLDEALEILKSSSVKNDELHVFGNLVAKKLERFDDLTRSRIQSAIMDIFVNADKGFYKQTCDLSSSNSTELCTPTHNALLYKTLQSPAARFQHSLANTSSVSSPFPSVPEISFSTPSRICHLSGILEPYMSEGMSGANI